MPFRHVALILNALDFLGTFTHMNAAVFSLLQELSSLESVKHARVHRKAKQITASFNDNIAKHSKEEVMPYLRTLADASLSVGEVCERLYARAQASADFRVR
eukprot:1120349-Pleurochrysis_carterae.AAC.1